MLPILSQFCWLIAHSFPTGLLYKSAKPHAAHQPGRILAKASISIHSYESIFDHQEASVCFLTITSRSIRLKWICHKCQGHTLWPACLRRSMYNPLISHRM